MLGAVDIAGTGAIRFIMFYFLVMSLFFLFVSLNDFSVFNEELENPADIDLTVSLDPISMVSKLYFLTLVAVRPEFVILGVILGAYSFVTFYIIIKALPFT